MIHQRHTEMSAPIICARFMKIQWEYDRQYIKYRIKFNITAIIAMIAGYFKWTCECWATEREKALFFPVLNWFAFRLWPKCNQIYVTQFIQCNQTQPETDQPGLLMIFIPHWFPFIKLKTHSKLGNVTQFYAFHQYHTLNEPCILNIQFDCWQTYAVFIEFSICFSCKWYFVLCDKVLNCEMLIG